MKLVKFIDLIVNIVNVFRLCSIINSLYSQVAGDLETCSRLLRIMIRHSREQVSKPPDRTTNNVSMHLPCARTLTPFNLLTLYHTTHTLTFNYTDTHFEEINKIDVENIAGKGETASKKQFLLFPQCFLHDQITVSPFVHSSDIISLFAAEFQEPNIGISGKGLNNPKKRSL